MSNKTDWKQKYYELRSKYMNAIDVSFRLGVQEGQKNQKINDMQMQLQQMQEAAAMNMGGEPDMGGEPGLENQPGMEDQNIEEGAEQELEGDNLDMAMDELEGYVKNEEKKYSNLLKSFHKQKDKKEENKKKITSILQKWDEEEEDLTGQSANFLDEESSGEEGADTDDILGQA